MPFSCFLFRPRKTAKSTENAVIPTFPTHWSHGLQHLRHKHPTFAFTSESGYTLGFRRRIAHSGSQGEAGRFGWGWYLTTLGALCVLLKRRTSAYQSGSFVVFCGRTDIIDSSGVKFDPTHNLENLKTILIFSIACGMVVLLEIKPLHRSYYVGKLQKALEADDRQKSQQN